MTAALIALHAVVFLNASRFLRPFPALGVIVLMDMVLVPMMLARPHLLAWAVVAGWTWLDASRPAKDRAPPFAAALLMIVWVNLHGSFVLGLVIARLLGSRRCGHPRQGRVVRQWGLFGLAARLPC